MAGANASIKGFHDQIKGMFNSGPATSTNSLPYLIESSLNATEDLVSEQKKHNKLALKLMDEQTKLLKRIAANDNGGLLGSVLGNAAGFAGGTILGKIFNRIFGGTRIGRVIQAGIGTSITQGISGLVKRAGASVISTLGQHVKTAFAVVAAAGRNIFAPIAGLKNMISASGVMKMFSNLGSVFKVVPRLLGKLLLPVTAIMGIADSVSGWKNADSILGKNGSSFGDKMSAAIGTAINGLLLGVPDWIVGKLGGGNTSKLLANGKDYVVGGLSTLGKGIGNLVGNGIKAITSGDFAERAYATFETVKNAVWDGLTSLAGGIKDALTGVFSDMWGALKDWWNGDRTSPPNFSAGRGKPAVTANGGTAQAPSTSFRSTVTPSSAQQISYTGDSPSYSNNVGPTGTGGGMGVATSSARQAANSNSILGDSASTAGPSSGVTPIKTVQRGGTALPEGVGDYRQASKADINTVLMNRVKKDFNLTDEQAAGMVGNFAHESAGYKAQQEYNPLGGGRGGLGFAQWTGSRRKDLENFAKERGQSPTSFETQYAFLKHELTNTHEKRVLDKLRQTTNVRDAAVTFEQGYERAGVKHYDSRIMHSEQALKEYNSNPVTKKPSDGNLPSTGKEFLSDKSMNIAGQIDPDLQAVILNAQKYMPEGETFQIGPSTIRTLEQQRQFVAQGKSKTMKSNHLTGRAADLDIYRQGKYVGEDHNAYGAMSAAMKKSAQELGVDIGWGGDWKGSWDKPHFELKKGYESSGGKILENYRAKQLEMAKAKAEPTTSSYKDGGPERPRGGGPGLGGIFDRNKPKSAFSGSVPTITSADISVKSADYRKILNGPSSFNDVMSNQNKRNSLVGKIAPASTLPTFDSLIAPQAANYNSPMPTPSAAPKDQATNSALSGDTGAKQVAEIPTTDEYKMLLANGSRLT